MAETNEGQDPGSVLTQICLNCGQEYFYDTEPPPADQTCERCGSQVFRSYYAPTTPDEVQQDFQDTTARDTLTDDPGTDIAPGDLYDLNNP